MERRGIFSPDRNHVHYRLQGIGCSHHQAVAILWAESGTLTVLALLPVWLSASATHQAMTFVIVALLHLAFFRLAGAVRLRDSLRALRAGRRRAQEARRRRREYDSLDLQFRQVHTMEGWCRALEDSAERLGFVSLRIELPRRTGDVVTRTWRGREGVSQGLKTTLTVPDRRSDQSLRLHVELASESLEAAAEGVTMLGKLVDRYPASQLGKDEWRAPRAVGVADPA
jgi:UDP-GlcNAc:undecaprenyl-phosphate GlcNAc-1-phosphate transferase